MPAAAGAPAPSSARLLPWGTAACSLTMPHWNVHDWELSAFTWQAHRRCSTCVQALVLFCRKAGTAIALGCKATMSKCESSRTVHALPQGMKVTASGAKSGRGRVHYHSCAAFRHCGQKAAECRPKKSCRVRFNNRSVEQAAAMRHARQAQPAFRASEWFGEQGQGMYKNSWSMESRAVVCRFDMYQCCVGFASAVWVSPGTRPAGGGRGEVPRAPWRPLRRADPPPHREELSRLASSISSSATPLMVRKPGARTTTRSASGSYSFTRRMGGA